MTPEQTHRLGQAIAISFAAVRQSGPQLRAVSKLEGISEAHAVGEVALIALARAGFVVEFDPKKARAVEIGLGAYDPGGLPS